MIGNATTGNELVGTAIFMRNCCTCSAFPDLSSTILLIIVRSTRRPLVRHFRSFSIIKRHPPCSNNKTLRASQHIRPPPNAKVSLFMYSKLKSLSFQSNYTTMSFVVLCCVATSKLIPFLNCSACLLTGWRFSEVLLSVATKYKIRNNTRIVLKNWTTFRRDLKVSLITLLFQAIKHIRLINSKFN